MAGRRGHGGGMQSKQETGMVGMECGVLSLLTKSSFLQASWATTGAGGLLRRLFRSGAVSDSLQLVAVGIEEHQLFLLGMGLRRSIVQMESSD